MKILILSMFAVFMAAQANAKDQTRCGWISNPTPANYWLNDADGKWIIIAQGSYQDEGDIKVYPTSEQTVMVNDSYGYWCGCITGSFDKDNERVSKITSSSVENLYVCSENPNLI